MISVSISKIKVHDRLRQDLGDIDGLADSIRTFGLFHPIIVDDSFTLVAGHRRLEACRKIGKRQIDVRQYSELTDEERREIELEENLRRKDLTAAEQARRAVLDAEAAKARAAAAAKKKAEEAAAKKKADEEAARAKADVKTCKDCGTVLADKRYARCPPCRNGSTSEPGTAPDDDVKPSQDDIADAAGTSRRTLARNERHVALLKRFPFMESPVWTQSGCFAFADAADKLPAADLRRLTAILRDLLYGDPKNAISMAESLSSLEPDHRERILRAAESADKRDSDAAIQMLAKAEGVEPDPRMLHLLRIEGEIRKQAKRFSNDAMNANLSDLADRVREVAEEMRRHHAARREEILR